jgi:hypothetical protein
VDCLRPLLGFAAVLLLLASAVGAQPQQIGAVVPWTTYEAEQLKTTGLVIGPDYAGHTAAREASGRRCVRLGATGQFLELTAKADAQGLVVRYSIPNTPDGRGADATLSLYINGQLQQKLPLTSRYCYLYGPYPFSNDPASGTPRHFWDELRIMPGTIHAGDVIRFQKDADDAAAEYLIDLVDLETVPSALQQPTNSLSITEFGATPNGPDAHPAFTAAIAAAKAQHKTVWIPPGQFVVKGPIRVSDITIAGAGMWYSALVGVDDYSPANRLAIYGNGSNITLSDFALIGKLRYRNDAEPNDGLGDSFGTGSVIRNIWVEHTKTGAWLVNSDGLVVEGCRFRDTIADGINLCIGMRNTTVRNCTARGTGDDCFAIWPATYNKSEYAPGHNRILNCTAQLPFLAQGFGIYGGDSNSVENCSAIDIPYGCGLLASTMFPTEFGFRGTTSFRHVAIERSGDNDGAIGIMTNLVPLAGLRFGEIDVIDSPTDGIKFNCIKGLAISDVAFDQIRIQHPGVGGAGCGIVATRGTVGTASLRNVSVTSPATAECQNNAAAFNLVKTTGDDGPQNQGQPGADFAAARQPPGGP